MSIVTDAKTNRIIFCEGNPSSPDITLWQQVLIADVHPNANYRCEIKPMGGKQAAQNFAAGYELATNNNNWLVVRDRDLDAEPDGSIVRWGSGERVILTGHTCIESYFVSSDLTGLTQNPHPPATSPSGQRGASQHLCFQVPLPEGEGFRVRAGCVSPTD
jgi:hypothetical protein